MSSTVTKDALTASLAKIFYEAMAPTTPGLKPEDVTVERLVWNKPAPLSQQLEDMERMAFLGIKARIHHNEEVIVEFPQTDIDTVQSLQKAVVALTGHWVAYGTSHLEIKANAETVAAHIDDPQELQEIIAAQSPAVS
jgi:hypothetical protein